MLLFNCIYFAESEQEVLQFENLDLETIKTPVNIPVLKLLLMESNYDKKETEFLIDYSAMGSV